MVKNCIEEFKNQLNLSETTSSDYMAGACFSQMVVLAHNLANWFRRLLLWGELRKAEVAILLRKVFTMAAKLDRHAPRVMLSLMRAFPRQRAGKRVGGHKECGHGAGASSTSLMRARGRQRQCTKTSTRRRGSRWCGLG